MSEGLIDHPALDLSAGGWPPERVVIHRESLRTLLRSAEWRDALWDAVDDAIVAWNMDGAASVRRDTLVDAVIRVLAGDPTEEADRG